MLEVALVCKELNVLPGPGGVFDQDNTHMRYLRAALPAIAAAEKHRMEQERRNNK